MNNGVERLDTVVIGGGQAGLAVGYELARLGVEFVILDGNARVGDSWRNRWDSLRLFTPAGFDGLVGMPFPAPRLSFPTKDELADYLESYAERFRLPVRNSVAVDGLRAQDGRFVVSAGGRRFEAERVVVATGGYGSPRVPAFATSLNRGIMQLHSSAYQRPSQLAEGDVLVVGAGNSGAEIAVEASHDHRVWLSGRHPGHIPVRHGEHAARFVFPVVRFLGHRVLTVDTPIGRRVRPRFIARGNPLIRVKPKDIDAAGIERVPRVVGVRDGLPELADGRVLDVANVVWCTGFHPDFSWIDLPVLDDDGQPVQRRGIVADAPGLYFVGLEFMYSASSGSLPGIGRDAGYVAEHIAAQHGRTAQPTAEGVSA